MNPIIETDRLLLRPFSWDDFFVVKQLFDDSSLYDDIFLKHFYYQSPESFIRDCIDDYYEKDVPVYAITLKTTDRVVGAIMLASQDNNEGMMGYWIGKSYRRNGYCLESVKKLCDYGFKELNLAKINFVVGTHNMSAQLFIKNLPVERTQSNKDFYIYTLS